MGIHVYISHNLLKELRDKYQIQTPTMGRGEIVEIKLTDSQLIEMCINWALGKQCDLIKKGKKYKLQCH